MFAVYAEKISREDPLSGLVVGERPDPVAPEGWATITVKAASLNHHDLWSLKGQGLKEERLPMILGCDAAGVDEDGRPVVVHAVISHPDWTGDETLDPKRSLLSELHQGTFADRVIVPRRNIVPLPAASPLVDRIGATDKQLVVQRGGHVGAVVSKKAADRLWPVMAQFWAQRD